MDPAILPVVAVAGTTTTVSARVGVALSFSPFASLTNGYPPYIVSVQSGTLPAGLTINSVGVVSGTPTTVQAAANVVFAVTDYFGNPAATTVTVNFTVLNMSAVAGATTTVSTAVNQSITSFSPFSSVTGGVSPLVYYVSSGTLPPGITINSSTGLVSGTPTTVQSASNVIFAVRDSAGNQATTTVTVGFTVTSIVAVAGATTTVFVVINTAITNFSPFSSVSYGYTPYTYFVSSGTLPTGITLNSSTGVVSGTPTALYTAANVVFAVKDAQNNQAVTTVTVSFEVVAPGYTLNYLIVAGGGGGGYSSVGSYGGGGGGGGGFLSGNTYVSFGNPYSIQVGAGGLGSTGTGAGAPGNNSIFSSFTSIGGGGGGSTLCAPVMPGQPGGSGGGGMGYQPMGIAIGSPGYGVAGTQGYPGGAGITLPGIPSFAGGSGGGAGGTGNFSTCTVAGPGGLGRLWPFNNTTYAGGGGAGLGGPGSASGPSPGGGASGGPFNPPLGSVGFNAGTNTGGGGGGGSHGTSIGRGGGNGAAGTVALAIPTPFYPGVVAPGAAVSTPANAPGYTVLTYTTPGPTVTSPFTFTA